VWDLNYDNVADLYKVDNLKVDLQNLLTMVNSCTMRRSFSTSSANGSSNALLSSFTFEYSRIAISDDGAG